MISKRGLTIIKPVISEKSVKEAQLGRYTFLVSLSADKTRIKNDIKKLFGVDPVKVFTSRKKGSITRTTKVGRSVKKFSFKKARVVLAKGQKIQVFEEMVNKS